MKLTLNKSIEAKKLNKRTGAPSTEPESTVPYGALIDHQGRDGNAERFLYMGELFRCAHDVLASALEGGKVPKAAAAEPPDTAADTAASSEPTPAQPRLEFEALGSTHHSVSRAKVPGGWLVVVGGSGITFLPDSGHEWNGLSIP
ncbi:MAG TPA: hypothetical protein VG456_19625 [Candidatus Sulfopaludibacter sp.]|jgi:hypothetical protein|nr:hypothetical protein [Candidatus Sulfopaludibacter sp.]